MAYLISSSLLRSAGATGFCFVIKIYSEFSLFSFCFFMLSFWLAGGLLFLPLAHFSFLVVAYGLRYFLPGIHNEGAVGYDRFIEWYRMAQ